MRRKRFEGGAPARNFSRYHALSHRKISIASGDVNQVAFAGSFRAIRLLFYRDAENLMNSGSWLCMCGDLRRYCFLAGLFLEAFQG